LSTEENREAAGRKLAAIMFTDIVGYTSLTQQDEASALKLLHNHNRLLRPFFSKFGGREIKTIGDSFLVEFDSALDAVNCAIEIQNYLESERESSIESETGPRIRLRIGIHLGDVVHRDNDIFGDAVNIASRIQPICEPGGVCVSEQVFDQVRNKISYPLEKLDERELKNVKFKIDIYRIVLPWQGNGGRGRRNRNTQSAVDRKRIAVLPFANMSPDPADEYFADGMTEELITALARIKELTVIARTSVMKYKTPSKSASEIGRELSVGTLIEGSVRKAGNRVRISVQLIDAENEGHIWAQSYDKELVDIFAIQSEVAERVAKELKIQLIESERRRLERKPTESAEAYTLYLKGRYQWYRRTRDSFARALEYFKLALDVDPNYAPAYVGVCDCYSLAGNFGYMEPLESHTKAKEAALRAIELDDSLGEAHLSLAWILIGDWEWDRAEEEFKRALDLSPSNPLAHRWYAHFLLMKRRYDEAMQELEEALQLDPESSLVNLNIAEGLFMMGKYDESIKQYKKTLAIDPSHVPTLLSYVFALPERGMFEEARRIQRKLSEVRFPEQRIRLFEAYTLAKEGNSSLARRILEQVISTPSSDHIPLEEEAAVYVALQDSDKAFELLNKAVDAHSDGVVSLKYWPRFAPLHSDPRFGLLLKKMKLEWK
jgi:adenylate cyclase